MNYLPRRRTSTAAVALLATLCLTLSACGGSHSHSTKTTTKPQSQPTQGGTKLAAVWPLTGLPATTPTPKRPVMVVKFDNTPSSDPQSGLSKADLVTEELVEGGITRIAAFYYSHLPKLVGPVRSMRASDIGLVKPAHAVLVTSGGAPPTISRMAKAHVTWYGQGSPGFFRDPSGKHDYLHSLFVHLPELARTLKKKAIVPASYLPWGKASDFAGGQAARHISVGFGADHTTQWTYANGTYDNTNSYAAPGDKFRPNTILVIRVKEGNAGYLDPAGNFVPEALYKGTGPALLFHDGQLVRGTWSKTHPGSPVTLRTASGPLKVPAGHVWVELQPQDNAGHGISGHISWSK